MTTFFSVNRALLPFTLFWVLLGFHHPSWAIWSGLAVSLAGNLRRAARREIFALEAGALAFFTLIALAHFMSPEQTAHNALWLSFASLGLISLCSIALGRPWTADYSRAAFPGSAGTPQFQAINLAMTGLWGLIFLIVGLCRWIGVSEWIAMAIMIAGILASIFGPRFAVRHVLEQLRAARETFHWPAPSFAARTGDCDVAIIGAGIGGLTAAALLADAGLRVKVFELHAHPGGFCQSYRRHAHHDDKPVTYRFDAGPHDFSGVWPGGSVSGLLERLGVADRLQWKRVRHTYRLAGRQIDVPDDWRDYVDLLCREFPGSAEGIRSLFETIHAIFEDMYSTGRRRSGIPGMPGTAEEMLAFPKNHPQAFRWMKEPFDKLVAEHVSDPVVVRMLNALLGYLGDGGEQLTCAQMAPIFGYYFKGGHYPVGGSGAFTDALVKAIESRDGEVRLNSRVERILVQRGRAAGVVLNDGKTVHADAVVSNADIKRTFTQLLAKDELPADFRNRIVAAKPANSAFSVHLGLDFDPDVRPAVHVDAPRRIGMAMLSKVDPSAAPDGHSTLMLISMVPYSAAETWFPAEARDDWRDWRRSEEYESRKQKLGDELIAAAETAIPDLRRHIVCRADASPVTYARYDWSSSGAIYGVSREGRLLGSKSPLRNLVIAGSGNSGAGVEAAVISGAEAAEALVPGLLSRSDGPAPEQPAEGRPGGATQAHAA